MMTSNKDTQQRGGEKDIPTKKEARWAGWIEEGKIEEKTEKMTIIDAKRHEWEGKKLSGNA